MLSILLTLRTLLIYNLTPHTGSNSNNLRISILSIVVLWLSIFTSCKQDQKATTTIPIIAPTEAPRKFDLLKYVDDLEYIPLEENESALLSHIVKMHKTEDQYVIRCHQRSSLFFFDLKGNFRKKVVATGDGPHEFSNLMDVAFDKEKMYLLDFENQKILIYDFNQNSIIQDHKLTDSYCYALTHFQSKLYAVSQADQYGRIKIFDGATLERIGDGIHDNSVFNFIATQKNMVPYNDTLFFNVSFTDTIYYTVGQTILPYAILGRDETSIGSLSNKKEYAMKYLHSELSANEKKVLVPRGFLSIYQDIWFIELIWPNKMVVWDKNRQIQRLLDFRNIENRELLFEYQLFKILFVDKDNYAYSYIMIDDQFYDKAYEIIQNKQDSYPKNIIDSLSKLIKTYPREKSIENPVIVRFKLNKQFTQEL